MKILGHPLHTMIIHFPTALLPMDFFLCLIGNYTHQSSFFIAGYYCLIAGTFFGLLALLTGLLDLVAIPSNNKEASYSAWVHGLINGSMMLIFGIIAYKSWKTYPVMLQPSSFLLWTKGILVAVLFFGNYLGGRLIYKHHIGIEILRDA
ncbi:MAG: DUF2231 domain-containing protein [Flavisolibacter sp.]